MLLPIRYYGDPVLRRSARPVIDFGEELVSLADDMIETMHDDSGVGLAAPQVGVPLRLFVAAELRFDDDGEAEHVSDHVFVNPRILERVGTQVVQEGCLSIPGVFVDDLERDMKVRVSFQDLTGKPREIEAHGHFAQVIQHESDHLDGVLFFDRLPADRRKVFLDEHRTELAQIQRRAKALVKELREAGRNKQTVK